MRMEGEHSHPTSQGERPEKEASLPKPYLRSFLVFKFPVWDLVTEALQTNVIVMTAIVCAFCHFNCLDISFRLEPLDHL